MLVIEKSAIFAVLNGEPEANHFNHFYSKGDDFARTDIEAAL